MKIFNLFQSREREAPPQPLRKAIELRPLKAIAAPTGKPSDIVNLVSTPAYRDALAYFAKYPPRSILSDESRAVIYMLIRTMRPEVVAEVGTMFAGTAEVMARALWENGTGIVHTTDPLGGDRCPQIIASWPQELQQLTRFYPLNSMDFFHHLDRQRVTLDLVLVDGNHDFEFAFFDLQMSARLLRPGGIVLMDNAEQTGPFKASQLFLANNREWRELGSAVASHARSTPFDSARASIPRTSFVILQAPDHVPVGEDFRSWGQVRTKSAHFDGIRLELPAQRTSGWLHYQAMLRAFHDDGSVPESKAVGKLRLEVDRSDTVEHPFDKPLRFPEGAQYTYEIDLAWEPDTGCPPLALLTAPTPL
jgi:predicted O-methyltransferase YrrM